MGELQSEESRDVRQHLKGSIHGKVCRKKGLHERLKRSWCRVRLPAGCGVIGATEKNSSRIRGGGANS